MFEYKSRFERSVAFEMEKLTNKSSIEKFKSSTGSESFVTKLGVSGELSKMQKDVDTMVNESKSREEKLASLIERMDSKLDRLEDTVIEAKDLMPNIDAKF